MYILYRLIFKINVVCLTFHSKNNKIFFNNNCLIYPKSHSITVKICIEVIKLIFFLTKLNKKIDFN